jgi:hypothetical protein
MLELSNVSANIAVAIPQLSTFDAAHPRKPKLHIELQPRKPKDRDNNLITKSRSELVAIQCNQVCHILISLIGYQVSYNTSAA